MNKEFIPYEQALELKELGFDEPCLAWHNSGRLFIDNYNAINSKMDFDYCCALPLYQQAFRWFREKYELHGEPFSQKRPADNFKYAFKISGKDIMYDGYDTYEEAELACLKKLIEVVKQNNI